MRASEIEEEPCLIVDDEPDICWALEHILESVGMISVKAQNGEAAMGLARKCRFSVAFLDVSLGDMDGLELARRIRSIHPAVPIILISGFSCRHDKRIEAALADGLVADFVNKPFENRAIIASLARTREP